jgi:hypothetical protein
MAYGKGGKGGHTGKPKAGKGHHMATAKKMKKSGEYGYSVQKGHESHDMGGLGSGYSPPDEYQGSGDGPNATCS